MEKTYSQLVQEIESMKQQAEAAREREVADVIARMKEAIQVYGLTAADLGLGPAPAKRGRKPGTKVARKAAGAPVAKKRGGKRKGAARGAAYADGTGNVWSGRGPRPRWLKEALASGHALEEFATKGK